MKPVIDDWLSWRQSKTVASSPQREPIQAPVPVIRVSLMNFEQMSLLLAILVPALLTVWLVYRRWPLLPARSVALRRVWCMPSRIEHCRIAHLAEYDNDKSRPDSPATGTTIIQRRPDKARRRRSKRPVKYARDYSWSRHVNLARIVGVFALGSLLLATVVLVPRILSRPPEGVLHVVVASFNDADGRTGEQVADELFMVLQRNSEPRIQVERVAVRPADAQSALQEAQRLEADLLIWGQVSPGAMLNSPTMLPQLIYTPTGWHMPNLWFNYQGRFVMPRNFVLSNQPINGQAVLPRILTALADYHLGNPDLAAEQLGALLAEYPLNPALPRALRGNVFWARGMFDAAQAEYGQALAQPVAEPAALNNNLAAIQLDAGNPAYRDSLNTAIDLLGGRDLGALRYNLGLAELREGRLAAAAVEFEQARNLLPANAAILLTITDIYRDLGYLDAAEDSLAAAETRLPLDLANVPAEHRELLRLRLLAGLTEQRGLLQMAQQFDARGPLHWELEVASPQPAPDLDAARDTLRDAAGISNALINEWLQFANASGAVVPESEPIAVRQVQLAREMHNYHQYSYALVLIEQARATLGQPPGVIEGIIGALFGNGTPMNEAVRVLNDEILQEDPDNAPAMIALGRTMRLQDLLADANAQYDEIIALVPTWPDGFFGKADLARRNNDPAMARNFLEQAIARNETYFPAYIVMAEIAEQQNDWPAVIASRRRLAGLLPNPANTIELARALHRGGESAEAETLLRSLAEQGAAPAYLELARIYSDTGRSDMAFAAFADALERDPASVEAAFELGLSLAAAGRYAEAEPRLAQALRNDPENDRIRLAYADVLQQQGQTAEANEQYRQLAGSSTLGVDELIAVGDSLAANGDAAAAADAYQQALERSPEHIKALQRVAQARFAENNLQGAAEAARQVVTIGSTMSGEEPRILRASAIALQGDIARRNGDPEQARTLYNQALGVDPVQTEARLGLGMLAVDAGNWTMALAEFERAAAYPSGVFNPLVHFWVAEARLRLGNYSGAVAAYSRALELDPAFADAHFGLAQTFYAQGLPDAALERVERALDIRPDYAEALLFKGERLQELGDTDGALAAYNASIEANNEIAQTFFRRGLIFMQRDEHDQAVSDLERAVDLQSNFPEAQYWLGRAYLAQESNERALAALQRAVALQQGNYPEARYYQGLAEESLGRIDAAVASYWAVVQNDPGGNWGDRAQVELERLRASAGVVP